MELTQTHKKVFLVASTLLPVLQDYVSPGTTVVSDLWGAYQTINNLGYQHLTVNHSIHFVDPVTHATTNHVESMWCKHMASCYMQKVGLGLNRGLRTGGLCWKREG